MAFLLQLNEANEMEDSTAAESTLVTPSPDRLTVHSRVPGDAGSEDGMDCSATAHALRLDNEEDDLVDSEDDVQVRTREKSPGETECDLQSQKRKRSAKKVPSHGSRSSGDGGREKMGSKTAGKKTSGKSSKGKPSNSEVAARKRHNEENAQAVLAQMERYYDDKFLNDNGPVFAAVRGHDLEALRVALAKHPDDVIREQAPVGSLKSNGVQPLHLAVSNGASAALVATLLEAGALPNAWCGRSTFSVALHFAASAGRADVVRLLLGHGADPTLRFVDCGSGRSSSPVEMAMRGNHREAAAILHSAEADWTPAHAAATAAVASAMPRHWPSAVANMLDNLREDGDTKSMILEMGNGCGGGLRMQQQGLEFLDAYAAALDMPTAALTQALRSAPGELDECWGAFLMPEQLRSLYPITATDATSSAQQRQQHYAASASASSFAATADSHGALLTGSADKTVVEFNGICGDDDGTTSCVEAMEA